MRKRADVSLATAALAFYAIHAGQHVWRGHWEDALWVCHLANLVAAAGFLFSSPRALGVALMWLVMGNAMWILYLCDGGELFPTSLLTHVGGLAVALVGCSRRGVPSGTWIVAAIGLVAVQGVSRLVTPPAANVNVAWAAYGNWDRLVPSYPVYVILVDAGSAALFWAIERASRSMFGAVTG